MCVVASTVSQSTGCSWPRSLPEGVRESAPPPLLLSPPLPSLRVSDGLILNVCPAPSGKPITPRPQKPLQPLSLPMSLLSSATLSLDLILARLFLR